MSLTRIFKMLEAASSGAPHFPPTELYCEGWMSRLVLDWFSSHPAADHPLRFAPEAIWFSEALLPSTFRPRFLGDPLGMARTHADGVIGHFKIGAAGKADCSLAPRASQFLVIEAKLNAPLAAGVKKAPFFDQAARNVACLVEVLRRAKRPAASLVSLSFCVIAPQAKIAKGDITKLMQPESISAKVFQQVSAYAGAQDDWFHQWFEPAFPFIDLHVLSWEEIIQYIYDRDQSHAQELAAFYEKSLQFAG